SDSNQSKQNTKTLDEATACGVYIFTEMHPILVMSYKKGAISDGIRALRHFKEVMCVSYA
ncbi:MAG: hypothetical protein J6A79_11170, partial [Clostridia bacterium]|nr:hypothetical protein [Clostridia bacterium]